MVRSRGIAQVAKSVESTEREEKNKKIEKAESAEMLQHDKSSERHLQRLSSKEKPTFSRTPSVDKEKLLATTTITQAQS